MTTEADYLTKQLNLAPASDHYKSGEVEPIHLIESQRVGFHLGNAIKYIVRAPLKGDLTGDLKKAIWYIERHISIAKQRAANHETIE